MDRYFRFLLGAISFSSKFTQFIKCRTRSTSREFTERRFRSRAEACRSAWNCFCNLNPYVCWALAIVAVDGRMALAYSKCSRISETIAKNRDLSEKTTTMNNVKVSLEEVVRHFLRTQSHKTELTGIDVANLSFTEALRHIQCKYPLMHGRMVGRDWYFCRLNESIFLELRALPASRWLSLSKGSLRIVDVTKNLMKENEEKLGDCACTRQKVSDLVKLMTTGDELFDWRIILDGEDYTVLDGTCRTMAMRHYFDNHEFTPFWSYLGFVKGNSHAMER